MTSIPKLRQQLSRLSDELVNLTSSDLEDLKWPIRRRIMSVLLDQSQPLSSFNEQLVSLCEAHEVESIAARTNNLPREERKEAEMIFRSQFMRIICHALERLRWPKAIEAFADPLQDLLHDKAIYLNAVKYILGIGGLSQPLEEARRKSILTPTSHRERAQREKQSSENKVSPLLGGRENLEKSREDSIEEDGNIPWNDSPVIDRLPTGERVNNNNNSKISRIGRKKESPSGTQSVLSARGGNSISTTTSRQSKKSFVSDIVLPEAAQPNSARDVPILDFGDISFISEMTGGVGMDSISTSARSLIHTWNENDSARSTSRTTDNMTNNGSKSARGIKSACTTSSDSAMVQHLIGTIQYLQSHNETLARTLKNVMTSVSVRDSAERHMDLLGRDLIAAVAEIVKSYGSGKNDKDDVATITGKVNFRDGHSDRGVWTEDQEYTYTPSEEVAQFLTDGDPANVSMEEDDAFQQEVAREAALEKDKTRAKKLTGACAGRGIYTVKRPSSANTSISNSSTTSKASVPTQANRKVTSNLIFRQIYGKLNDTFTEWKAARQEAQNSFLAPAHHAWQQNQANKGKKGKSKSEYDREEILSSHFKSMGRLRIHQVLGIQAPKSMPTTEADADSVFAGGGPNNYWLDMPRIRQLTADLLAVASSALELSMAAPLPVPNDKDESGVKKAKRVLKKKKSKSAFNELDSTGMNMRGSLDTLNTVSTQENDNTSAKDVLMRSSVDSFGSHLSGGDLLDSAPSSPGTTRVHEGGSSWGVGSKGVDPLPVGSNGRAYNKRLRQLQLAASELSLHLACLTPLAPLANDSPYTSSMTGLECVLSEMQSIVKKFPSHYQRTEAGKRDMVRVSEACDRARAEQLALIRCNSMYREQLHTWNLAGDKMSALFDTFTSNITKMYGTSLESVADLEGKIKDIYDYLDMTEESRVSIEDQYHNYTSKRHYTDDVYGHHVPGSHSSHSGHSGQDHSARLTNPLNALERGYLGEHLAALVRALRVQRKSVYSVKNGIDKCKRSLETATAKELSAFYRAKEAMLVTLAQSIEVISIPLPIYNEQSASRGRESDVYHNSGSNSTNANNISRSGKHNNVDGGTTTSTPRSGRKEGGGKVDQRPAFDNSISESPGF